MMMRLAVAVMVSAGFAASCGGGSTPPPDDPQPTTTTEQLVDPTTVEPDAGTPLTEVTEPEPDKPDPCEGLSTPKEELAEPDYEKGKTAYTCAETAAGEERFEVARFFYIVAHSYTKDPIIYFKIADSTRKAGDCSGAVIYYEMYLIEGKPDEHFRKKTVDAIALCEGGAKP
jgi:hypothetical protein